MTYLEILFKRVKIEEKNIVKYSSLQCTLFITHLFFVELFEILYSKKENLHSYLITFWHSNCLAFLHWLY